MEARGLNGGAAAGAAGGRCRRVGRNEDSGAFRMAESISTRLLLTSSVLLGSVRANARRSTSSSLVHSDPGNVSPAGETD